MRLPGPGPEARGRGGRAVIDFLAALGCIALFFWVTGDLWVEVESP